MIAEKIVETAAREYHSSVKKYHRMSEIGKCERALVYDWRGEEKEPISGRGMLIFNDGDMHHRDIRDRIRKAGFELIEEERELYDPNWNLSGHIDGIVCNNGDRLLLEIKSINHFQFERLNSTPLEDHIQQINLYMFYRDIDRGVILYKNKNTAAMKEFIIERDENLIQELLAKFERIDSHLKAGTLPDRPYPKSDWHCQYCQFQKICWAGVKEGRTGDKLVKTDDPVVIETADEYKRLSKEKKEAEDRLKSLKESLEGSLSAYHTGALRAGKFIVRSLNRKREKIDKTLIPEEILKKATGTSEYSCLEVREVK